jgi:hypothetical protein
VKTVDAAAGDAHFIAVKVTAKVTSVKLLLSTEVTITRPNMPLALRSRT